MWGDSLLIVFISICTALLGEGRIEASLSVAGILIHIPNHFV